MTLLLDTHVLLWAASGDSKLPKHAEDLIQDPASRLMFSVASIWEIVIKESLGREDLQVKPYVLRTRLLENGYEELPITANHALAVSTLPDLHKDPFDRILAAQAIVEGLSLITSDSALASYPGPIIRV